MAHNVCYGTVATVNGYKIDSWSVKPGDIVYDSTLNLYGVVEDCFTSSPVGRALLFVRFSGKFIKEDFTARYTLSDADKYLTVPNNVVLCSNGPVALGDEVHLVGFLGGPVAVVMKVKDGRIFCRQLSDKVPFSVWVNPSEVVKIEKRSNDEKENTY